MIIGTGNDGTHNNAIINKTGTVINTYRHGNGLSSRSDTIPSDRVRIYLLTLHKVGMNARNEVCCSQIAGELNWKSN